MRVRLKIDQAVIYLILGLGSAVMAFPLLYALLGSLCSYQDYYANPILPIPRTLYLENYQLLLSSKVPMGLWMVNTLIRISVYIVMPAVTSMLAGYAFARMRVAGREAVFYYLLSALMVPGIVFFIPTYIMMARWPGVGGNNWLGQGGTGLLNTWPALLITGWVSVYYIFLFRQTYYSIPLDFEEAARVDGAGTARVLWDVYLPMLKPTLTVLVIFQAVAVWNDYQWPLIVSSGNPKITTMALGVQKMAMAGIGLKKLPPGGVDWPFTFAIAIMATVPTVILFLWLQRYFVEGVQGFAIKG